MNFLSPRSWMAVMAAHEKACAKALKRVNATNRQLMREWDRRAAGKKKGA